MEKCRFCEYEKDRERWFGQTVCGFCIEHNQFKLKKNMTDKQQFEWFDYCLTQGIKDVIEEERKTEMNTNTVDKAVIVDRILKDFANHRHYRIDGEYHIGNEITTYVFYNGITSYDVKKVTIEFIWNMTEDNIYETIGRTTKFIDEKIGNKSKEKEAEEYIKYDTDSFKWPKDNLYIMAGRANGKTYYTSELIKSMLNSLYGVPEIEKVIFNDPATIVIWGDGTKTVVKAQNGEPYDPEKGLAMAITKKALGNKREYYHTVKHWVKKYEKKDPEFDLSEITNFKTLDEAKAVRNGMIDIIDNYGFVTVADLYDLNAKEISYVGNMYGWNNIHVEDSPSIIKLADDHYRLVLPKYVRIANNE